MRWKISTGAIKVAGVVVALLVDAMVVNAMANAVAVAIHHAMVEVVHHVKVAAAVATIGMSDVSDRFGLIFD